MDKYVGSLKLTIGGTDSPALTEDGTIYIGSLDNHLYAINHDGTLKWRFDAQDDIIESSPTISEDGTIYSYLGLIPRSLLRWG